MNDNPHSAPYARLSEKVLALEAERRTLQRQLTEHDGFKPAQVHHDLAALSDEIMDLTTRQQRLEAERAEASQHIGALQAQTALRWDPRQWFSEERAAKRHDLQSRRAKLDRLDTVRATLDASIAAKRRAATGLQGDLHNHELFESTRIRASARIPEIATSLALLNPQREQLRRKRDALEAKLHVPRKALAAAEARADGLLNEIRLAQAIEHRLSHASNGAEKARAHQACREAFGIDSPGRVLSERARALEPVRRDIAKLQDRMAGIARQRDATDLAGVGIDGNNLCYRYNKFIGLEAVIALANALCRDCEVLVIFDASIRSLLRASNRDVASRFPDGVKVHIVTSRHAADETLLDATAAANWYVVSNDRYADFPDKAVVREQRRFTHEIVEDRVLVGDLGMSIKV